MENNPFDNDNINFDVKLTAEVDIATKNKLRTLAFLSGEKFPKFLGRVLREYAESKSIEVK